MDLGITCRTDRAEMPAWLLSGKAFNSANPLNAAATGSVCLAEHARFVACVGLICQMLPLSHH
ncbi:MAG TPA: hypothetical protein PLB25_04790 [Rhodoferax sp.]|nr:hypothetical protein [Rhodoferax sp.]